MINYLLLNQRDIHYFTCVLGVTAFAKAFSSIRLFDQTLPQQPLSAPQLIRTLETTLAVINEQVPDEEGSKLTHHVRIYKALMLGLGIISEALVSLLVFRLGKVLLLLRLLAILLVLIRILCPHFFVIKVEGGRSMRLWDGWRMIVCIR